MGGVNCYQTSIGLLTQNVPTSINTLVLDRDRRRSTHPKLNSVVLTFLPDKCCIFCCFRLSFTNPNASFALERHNDIVMIYLMRNFRFWDMPYRTACLLNLPAGVSSVFGYRTSTHVRSVYKCQYVFLHHGHRRT